MKAAIIGGGFAGAVHAEALRSAGVTPYLIVTEHAESARAFAEKYEIPLRSSHAEEGYEKVFSAGVDAVHICTPPTSHGKAAAEILSHGLPVLCEKPLALTKEEAQAIRKAAEEGGGLCALTFNVRYHAAVKRAKEILSEGTLGKPLLVHGNYLQEFHAFPAPYDWRYDPERGGRMRAVTEIGTHWFDLAAYLTGEKVTRVSAAFRNIGPERALTFGKDVKTVLVSTEDAAAIMMETEGGILENVFLSEVSPGRGNHLSIEITCENGSLWWNEEDNNRLFIARKGEGIRTELFAFGNGFGDTFESLVRDFYRAVRTPETADDLQLPSLADGVYSAAVCDAVYESAVNGSVFTEVGPLA